MRSRGSDYTTYTLSLCTSWCDEKQLFTCVVLPQTFLHSLILWYLKNEYLFPCLFYKWLLSGKNVSKELALAERGWSVWCAEGWEMEFFSLLLAHQLAPTLPAVNLKCPCSAGCGEWPGASLLLRGLPLSHSCPCCSGCELLLPS